MKHAFLIMAHGNFEILTRILTVLDHEDSAFYLHIDQRASFTPESLQPFVQKGCIAFVQQKKIYWGGFSQIDCELRLFRLAAQGQYDYYHVLSGVDFPLKPYEELDTFCTAHQGREFIHFDGSQITQAERERISVFHVFQKNPRSKVNGALVKLQRLLGVDRLRGCTMELQKGANWCSITHGLVMYLLEQEALIRKMFRFSITADEMFLQTIVHNSPFRQRLYSLEYDNDYHSCMRLIDWERGNPYVFRSEDLEMLLKADYLFARKFDEKVDLEIVEKLAVLCKED